MSFTTFETSDPPTKQLALPERKNVVVAEKKGYQLAVFSSKDFLRAV